jgi:hypothetical protein
MFYDIGQKVTKLQILKLLIAFWPYKNDINGFSRIVMPWLQALSRKSYLQTWTLKCQQTHGKLLIQLITLHSLKPDFMVGYVLQSSSAWHNMAYQRLYVEKEI